ncbi:MAG: hypothetical protein PWP65_10 [Clostridia bacterium]|nr:hypothetical protein [Clostridia bacterium]
MEPRLGFWIDARGERLNWGTRQEVVYCIDGLNSQEVRQKIYAALGGLVCELAILPDRPQELKVIYDPARVSPGFLDYLLQQKGVSFRRQGG